jgi:DNA-binding CsgD family transcriptional regulator
MLEAGTGPAGETVRAALATYERLGASWDAARCARAARSHGLQCPVPARGGRHGYGDDLSPREEQIARLAAAGRSDKEIAAQLFLSPLTVRNHLDRAMRKLGVHRRAAVAARLDPG